MDSPRLLTAGLQSNSVCDQTTTEKPLRPDTELRIRRICDSSACWASESESGRNHNMLGRSPRLLHVSSEGKKRRGDARTRRRGDAETRGREDGATRGRGDARTRRRGDAETRGRGDAGTRRRGDAGTRGRADAETRGRGDAGTRRRGDARTRRWRFVFPVSPCHRVSVSPRLPIFQRLFMANFVNFTLVPVVIASGQGFGRL